MPSSDNQVLREYRSPHPRARRLAARLLAVGLVVMGAAAVLQVAVMIILVISGLPGWLFGGTAFFTVVLMIPLLVGTVLHPQVRMTADGLVLHPMIWRAQPVAWDAIKETLPHPLIFNDVGTGRLLYGKRYRPREGMVVIVAESAGLWPVYRLVGSIAGAGSVPAFGISSTTHLDYEVLAQEIRAHSGKA